MSLPPHDKNIYPYHGEGDKGGEVDKWAIPTTIDSHTVIVHNSL